MAKSISLRMPKPPTPVVQSIGRVLRRQVHARCGESVKFADRGELTITLELNDGSRQDSFRVEDGPGGEIRICGDTNAGLLHGLGRFLRSSRFNAGDFVPGPWRGASVPGKEVRGIYFATHFHNFYHDGPVDDVRRYVEDLGLWGYNALTVWFDMHHYRGISDPKAQEMIQRLRAVLQAAKDVGMKVGLVSLANEAYADSPEGLRSDSNTGRAHYGVELCPSKPGACELMLKWQEERLRAFADLGLDYVWLWPYDQGGCACKHCAPWGANGFLRISEAAARLFRHYFPDIKVVLSTWLFDFEKDQGEWEGLSRAFATRPDWVDYVMADSHAEFPQYPLRRGVPGGLPMLDFPEISMHGMRPWGGFGANPLPKWFQRFWDASGHVLSGGFPYSEGIFEDINKAIWAQFYWQPDKPAMETVREYAAFEYSPDVADDVILAIGILEANHERRWNTKYYAVYREPVKLPEDAGSAEALSLIQKADARLSGAARKGWRWRILLLRAQIDAELFRNSGVPGQLCEAAFEELEKTYWAENAEPYVHPPTRAMRQRNQ